MNYLVDKSAFCELYIFFVVFSSNIIIKQRSFVPDFVYKTPKTVFKVR